MPVGVAKSLAKLATAAIADERAAIHGRWDVRRFHAEISKSQSKLDFIASGSLAHDDSGAAADARGALRDDEEALLEAKTLEPDVERIKKLINSAIRLKTAAHANLMAIVNAAPTITPTTPATPVPGPLTACVTVENDGNSSKEFVHVAEAGAAGASGKVSFNGQGVNQTTPFTFDSNGTGVVSFPVTTFGAAVITIDVTFVNGQVVALSFGFTLAADNDGGPQSCTPSATPPGH